MTLCVSQEKNNCILSKEQGLTFAEMQAKANGKCIDLIYWSVVLSSCRRGGDGGIVILASCSYHFIRIP